MTAPLHQRAGSASSSTSPIVPSPSSSTSSTQSQQEIEDSQHVLVDTAVSILDQGQDLVANTLNDDQFTFESRLVAGSTIGKHLRHILDHFRLLVEAIESGSATLNYDVRKRQTPIETSTSSAREAIKDLQRRLQTLSEPPVPVQDGGLGREWLNVEVALSAQTPALISMKSTFGRELWFASHHAIHHLASIRVIAVGGPELDVDLPVSFGVAPSTILARTEAESARPAHL